VDGKILLYEMYYKVIKKIEKRKKRILVMTTTTTAEIYLLYKIYSNFITKKFVPKKFKKMNTNKLNNYYMKLKLLYNYSKICYTLREKLRDKLDENERDTGHDIAIDIVKQYNKDVLETIKQVKLYIDKHNKSKKYNYNNLYDIFNENTKDEKIDTKEELIDERNIEYEEQNSPIKIKPKLSPKTTLIKEIEDDKLLNNLILKQQELHIKTYNVLKDKLNEYNIKWNEYELYFAIQDLSWNFSIKTYQDFNESDKEEFIKHIYKIDKKELLSLIIHIKQQITHDCGDIDGIYYITVILGGHGGIGQHRLLIHKTNIIQDVIDIIVEKSNKKLIKDDDYYKQIAEGRTQFILSRAKYYVGKSINIDSKKRVYEEMNNNDTVYLHLYFPKNHYLCQ